MSENHKRSFKKYCFEFCTLKIKYSSPATISLNVRCGVQGSAAASPAAGAGEEAEHGQGPGRIQALLQGEDEALRPGGSTLKFK